jgi:2-keto-4-pentenoate hydratase/2-oxohepta-3-ene-1,7-dioic acid hydratase in catechol pathway
MIDVFDLWEEVLPGLCRAAEHLEKGPGIKRDELSMLAPLMPRQIVCAGANYRKHVIDNLIDHPGSGSDPSWSLEERRRRAERIMDHRAAQGQPFAFIKAQSAVLAPYADLALPADSAEMDWELELGVVIGKPARRVSREGAMDYVAGYVVCNDISARDHISRPDFPTLGLDFLTAKSGPGFLPLGPTIVPAQFVPNPQDLMLTLRLNGETMQHESTNNMIFPIAQLIEYVTTHMQLLPGDLLCTGSPSGNGTHHRRFLKAGDLLEGSIDSLGTQRNRCIAEQLAEGAVLHRPFVALRSP